MNSIRGRVDEIILSELIDNMRQCEGHPIRSSVLPFVHVVLSGFRSKLVRFLVRTHHRSPEAMKTRGFSVKRLHRGEDDPIKVFI